MSSGIGKVRLIRQSAGLEKSHNPTGIM